MNPSVPLWVVTLTPSNTAYGEPAIPRLIGVFGEHKAALMAGMAAALEVNIEHFGRDQFHGSIMAYLALARAVEAADDDPTAAAMYAAKHDKAIEDMLGDAEAESSQSGFYPQVEMAMPESMKEASTSLQEAAVLVTGKKKAKQSVE